jgi:hypothetical protein
MFVLIFNNQENVYLPIGKTMFYYFKDDPLNLLLKLKYFHNEKRIEVNLFKLKNILHKVPSQAKLREISSNINSSQHLRKFTSKNNKLECIVSFINEIKLKRTDIITKWIDS